MSHAFQLFLYTDLRSLNIMNFDYNLIYLIIGFLFGVIVSIYVGVITHETAFIIVSSASIAGILGNSLSKIISDEVKRKRDHAEKNKMDVEQKKRKHIISQILPLLDDWRDTKIYSSSVWRDMAFLINRGDYDFLVKREYYLESKSHLKEYKDLWEKWEKVDELIESVNEDGNIIINGLRTNLEQKMSNKFPELTASESQNNVNDNQYLVQGILQRIVFRRLYELLNNINYNASDYMGENRGSSINIGNQVLAISDESTLDKISMFFVEISENFCIHFPNYVEKTVEQKNKLKDVHKNYDLFITELKLLISRIDSGDMMLGKCDICKDW